MYLRLSDEQKMVQQTIRKFVETELIPLEFEVLKNEREGKPGISDEKLTRITVKGQGIWFLGH